MVRQLHGDASQMFEKPLQPLKQGRASRPEARHNLTYDEWANLSSLRSLLRSHAELCSALRSAGRQIFRLEGDVDFLSKLRDTIKNAETLRKAWSNPARNSPDPPAEFDYQDGLTVYPDTMQGAMPVTESGNSTPKRPRRRSRSNSRRVLKFRTEEPPRP